MVATCPGMHMHTEHGPGLRVCSSLSTHPLPLLPPVQGNTPSAIHPFKKIYGDGPTLENVEKWAGLVFSPSNDVFCVVQAQDRSAECLLYCSSECSTKQFLGCPT